MMELAGLMIYDTERRRTYALTMEGIFIVPELTEQPDFGCAVGKIDDLNQFTSAFLDAVDSTSDDGPEYFLNAKPSFYSAVTDVLLKILQECG